MPARGTRRLPGRARQAPRIAHAFLVGSICTIARPGMVVDINVAPDREHWWPGSPTLHLNPHGRLQNKKHCALPPVMPLLAGCPSDRRVFPACSER